VPSAAALNEGIDDQREHVAMGIATEEVQPSSIDRPLG
jgi:hypothetical protein